MVGEDDVQQRLGEPRREPVRLLDRASHRVVPERDLALEAPRVGEVDAGLVGRVGLELADVVQQRARDGDVAVDPREDRAHGAHRLRDGQRVLEQPVAVGLVEGLRGRRLAVARPRLRPLAEEPVQQLAEVRVLHGGDERPEVLLHVRGRARRAVVQVLVPPRAGRGDAQRLDDDLARRAAHAARDVDRPAGAHDVRHRVPHDGGHGARPVPQEELHVLGAVGAATALGPADQQHAVHLTTILHLAHEQGVADRTFRSGRQAGWGRRPFRITARSAPRRSTPSRVSRARGCRARWTTELKTTANPGMDFAATRRAARLPENRSSEPNSSASREPRRDLSRVAYASRRPVPASAASASSTSG